MNELSPTWDLNTVLHCHDLHAHRAIRQLGNARPLHPIDEAEALKPIGAHMVSELARAIMTTNFLIDCHCKRSQTTQIMWRRTATEDPHIVLRLQLEATLDANWRVPWRRTQTVCPKEWAPALMKIVTKTGRHEHEWKPIWHCGEAATSPKH